MFLVKLRNEAGSWWYATARLQVTVLTVICWSKEGVRTYFTYASHCLDQSSPFAMTCLDDALARVEAAGFAKQVLWADCGGHFRSCRFLGHVLADAVVARPNLICSELNFFVEGHGKGPCDAHFGRMGKHPQHVCSESERRIMSTLRVTWLCS